MTASPAPARRPLGRRILDVALLPAIAIGLALLFGAALMILSSPLIDGFDPFLPITAYRALLEGSLGSLNSIVNTLVNATRWCWPAWRWPSASRAACSTSAPRGNSCWARCAQPSPPSRSMTPARGWRSRSRSSPACWAAWSGGSSRASSRPSPGLTRWSPRSCSTSWPIPGVLRHQWPVARHRTGGHLRPDRRDRRGRAADHHRPQWALRPPLRRAGRTAGLVAPVPQHHRLRDSDHRRQPGCRPLRRHASALAHHPDDVDLRTAGRPGRRR